MLEVLVVEAVVGGDVVGMPLLVIPGLTVFPALVAEHFSTFIDSPLSLRIRAMAKVLPYFANDCSPTIFTMACIFRKEPLSHPHLLAPLASASNDIALQGERSFRSLVCTDVATLGNHCFASRESVSQAMHLHHLLSHAPS